MMVRLFIYEMAGWVINIYVLILIIRVFLSYGFLPPYHKVRRWVERITDPPIRFLKKHWGSYLIVQHMDFSPVVVLLLLLVVKRILFELLLG